MTTSRSPSSSAVANAQPSNRVVSVDLLRGLVMIIMALDHTREFFHTGAMSFAPENLERTNLILFLTRWITHICAPTFMFTAGLGAWFWLQRPGRTRAELARYLVTRGLWLVVLEFTVFRFAIFFSLVKGPVFLVTLWALGWSMVALAGLVWIPVRVLTVLSLGVILLHNLADRLNGLGWVWNLIHQPGLIPSPVPGVLLIAGYPLIPWIFVMSAGFCFGALVMTLDASARRQWMLRIGGVATAAFVLLRAINLYGDPRPWTTQFPGKELISFLNVTKNPPSLDFLLMTLGPALLLLALFEKAPSLSPRHPLLVYGRTPLFYFVAHFLLVHLLTIPFAWIRYGTASFLLSEPLPSVGGNAKLYPENFGYELWVVYLVWIGVVIAMYPLCVWYAGFLRKRRNQPAAG